MVDVIKLQAGESQRIDTLTNIVVVAVRLGNIDVSNDDGTYAGKLTDGEILTLPANSGKYVLYANSDSDIFVFRTFYI